MTLIPLGLLEGIAFRTSKKTRSGLCSRSQWNSKLPEASIATRVTPFMDQNLTPVTLAGREVDGRTTTESFASRATPRLSRAAASAGTLRSRLRKKKDINRPD